MSSPFPGMDPYLEAGVWSDLHHSLASYLRTALIEQIVPKYYARVEPYPVKDRSAQRDLGVMYPDVGFFASPDDNVSEPTPHSGTGPTPPTTTLRLLPEPEINLYPVHVYSQADHRLVTAIEVISPVNKRQPQLEEYRQKRAAYREAAVHLLEIDLIRRGTVPFTHPQLPPSAYRAMLTRAGQDAVEIWAFGLRDALPVLPVPLLPPDPAVTVDLGEALRILYARNHYHLSVDYSQPPPPPALALEDEAWFKERLAAWGESGS